MRRLTHKEMREGFKISDPLTPTECDLARRLHAAAIARGKAEAELERTPREGLPVAFRMRALAKVVQATLAWLRIYFEAVEHFKAAQGMPSGGPRREGGSGASAPASPARRVRPPTVTVGQGEEI